MKVTLSAYQLTACNIVNQLIHIDQFLLISPAGSKVKQEKAQSDKEWGLESGTCNHAF